MTARRIALLAALSWTAFYPLSGSTDSVDSTVEPGTFLLSHNSGLISLSAADAPLGSVIEALRGSTQIDIEGHVDADERINVTFEDLPLEKAISAISDRYIIVREESAGSIARIVLFRRGKEDVVADSAAPTLSPYPRAIDAWREGDIRSAINYFETAIDQEPDAWAPRADYARLLILMTDYERAEPHLQRSIELNPENPRIWLDMYSYYQRTVQVERALDAHKRAMELADGQAIVQDQTGLWRLERDSIFPGS